MGAEARRSPPHCAPLKCAPAAIAVAQAPVHLANTPQKRAIELHAVGIDVVSILLVSIAVKPQHACAPFPLSHLTRLPEKDNASTLTACTSISVEQYNRGYGVRACEMCMHALNAD